MDIGLIILFSFIGGFILNLMPCTLPILALKAYSVNKPGLNQENFRGKLLLTFAGVVVSFICMACIISLIKYSGNYVNIGFSFQQPVFIISVAVSLCFFLVGIRGDLGFITLAFRNKLADFFTGFFTATIAAPCAAPLMAVAFSYVLAEDNYFNIIVSFLFCGIGLGLPYILLAYYKNSYQLISKIGKLRFFYSSLEFMIIITILWLCYIYANLVGFWSSLLLFLSLILIKFALERKNLPLIIALVLGAFYFPQTLKNNIKKPVIISENYWKNFNEDEFDKAIADGDVVILDITADWCVTCKYNKFTVLDNPRVIEFLKRYNVIGFRLDYTKPEARFNQILQRLKIHNLPFTAIYSNKHKQAQVLSPLIMPRELYSKIQSAK